MALETATAGLCGTSPSQVILGLWLVGFVFAVCPCSTMSWTSGLAHTKQMFSLQTASPGPLMETDYGHLLVCDSV